MPIELLVELFIAAMIASAIFGGPVAAVITYCFLTKRAPWPVLPVAKPVQRG